MADAGTPTPHAELPAPDEEQRLTQALTEFIAAARKAGGVSLRVLANVLWNVKLSVVLAVLTAASALLTAGYLARPLVERLTNVKTVPAAPVRGAIPKSLATSAPRSALTAAPGWLVPSVQHIQQLPNVFAAKLVTVALSDAYRGGRVQIRPGSGSIVEMRTFLVHRTSTGYDTWTFLEREPNSNNECIVKVPENEAGDRIEFMMAVSKDTAVFSVGGLE